MPTQSEFEAAAQKFTAAAQLVGELVAAASGAGATQILVGGSLGRQVPDRIAAAEQAAMACHQSIMQAAETCLYRADVVAAYNVSVDVYMTAYGYFERASRHWASQFNAWLLDETGTVNRPLNPPRPPARPVRPAAWVE